MMEIGGDMSAYVHNITLLTRTLMDSVVSF